MARSPKRTFGDAVEISAVFVGVLFLMEFLDFFLPLPFDGFGIVPRTIPGLVGILFSPLLHANGVHLLSNALPLFILMVLLFWDRHYHPDRTLGVIWLASGLGTWVIGRPACHIGASSLIFGLAAYLIASGFWMRSWRSVFVALVVFLFYGGIFQGVLPQPGPVSWEGHLSGALAGFWAARKNHCRRR